jgi:hypothetical protein
MTGRGGRRALSVGAIALATLAALVGVALAASTNFVEPASSPEPAGAGPQDLVTADLDADTDADLAVVNVSSGSVTVHRNNGSGNFSQPASSPETPASFDFPTAIDVGDLDGDADRDLAVANQLGDNVTILRNNGSGNFTEPGTSPEPTGANTFAVTAADLDEDDDIDLAVANGNNPTGAVTVLLNNGSANFSPASTSPETVGNTPVSIAAADLDGDGDNDLGVANQQNGSVTVLRNNGTANFSQPVSSPHFVGTFPQGITAARLDADADVDLAVNNQGSDNVSILLNSGNANFSQPATSPEQVGDRPLAPPVAADFDLDGDLDLATENATSEDVTILRNVGAANFIEPASSPELVGPAPRGIVGADFDGDLDPDLAVTNQNGGNLTILRNR